MAHILFKPLLLTSITTSSILSGCLFSLSYVSTASLLSTPGVAENILLSQWKSVFLRGFHICPTSAAFASLCSFINAFLTWRYESLNSGEGSSKVLPLIIAGIFMIGLIPYTLSLIVPTEELLLEKEAKFRSKSKEGVKSEESSKETKWLMNRWAKLNYGRTLLPLTGALLAWSIW